MSTDITYTLVVTADGMVDPEGKTDYIAECVAGLKGAGEAKIELEKMLRGINFAASSVNLKFKSLVQESP